MLNNGLLAPTKNQLKNYGHNIIELYDECVKISISNKGELPNRRSLNNTNQKLLELLSDFAQTTRYHNLDALSTQQAGKDPLEHWGEIMLLILEQDVIPFSKIKDINMVK